MFVKKSSSFFATDLPFLCEQMQILLRAGFSLPQVFENLSDDFQGAVQKTIQTICKALKSGEDLSFVLQQSLKSSSELSQIVWLQTLLLYLQFGGNIIQALETLREMAQETLQDERMKHIGFAQGKATLIILVGLWFFSLLFLRIFSFEAFTVLFTTLSGQVLFVLSLLLFLGGLFSLKRIMEGKAFFWQKRKQRLDQYEKELPFLLHLVSFVVLSGANIHYAFHTVFKMKGLLLQQNADSFFKDADSYASFDVFESKETKDFQSFRRVLKRLLKSQQMGGSAAPFLQYQIRQIQMQHRQNLEEKNRIAIIKMSLPLAIFIFPSLLLLYIGPSLLLFLRG